MIKTKKNCANCFYGLKLHSRNKPTRRYCHKRSKIAKGEFLLVDDDYKCRNWKSKEEENNA